MSAFTRLSFALLPAVRTNYNVNGYDESKAALLIQQISETQCASNSKENTTATNDAYGEMREEKKKKKNTQTPYIGTFN